MDLEKGKIMTQTTKKKFQFQTGSIRTMQYGRSPGNAFRRAMRKLKKTQKDFGELVRWREIGKWIWFYQDPHALRREP